MRSKYFLIAIVLITAGIFISRLYYLQVAEDEYKFLAASNTRRDYTVYPSRGYIYDRNDSLVVSNQPAYNLCATYSMLPVEKDSTGVRRVVVDTTALSLLLEVDREVMASSLKKFRQVILARKHSRHQPYAIISQISVEDYPRIKERLYKFPGFSLEKTTMRHYHYPNAANVLGFLSEVSPNAKLDEDSDYKIGDILGATGVEKMYEKQLRGKIGHTYKQVDVSGRVTGAYMNGKYDTPSQAGRDINIALDINLQRYGESLMTGKRGSIIAIEPSTGEILALVTAPSYDPALLSGRERNKNYAKLVADPSQPMFDRGLIAEYSPGSPWKIVTGLAGLQSGAVTPSFSVYCGGGYRVGNHVMGCKGGVGQTLDMRHGYQYSCNVYFATVYSRTIERTRNAAEGMRFWSQTAMSLGFGKYLGTDLSTGRKGFIPTVEFYDKAYGKGRWKASTTISNAIGQGEITVTPMHLANLAATVANRGYYFRPHIIKNIKDEEIDTSFTSPVRTGINPSYFDVVADGMANVFKAGTARAFALPDIEMCGKTGTVENFRKINGHRVKLPDHSMFVAFAPRENPVIAIAVVVENGVWGSRWAAPIASLMMEYYIRGGNVTRPELEKTMMEGSLESTYRMYQESSKNN